MEPFIQHLIDEDSNRQANYRLYRDYYDGRQGVVLTRRQRQYLHVPPDKEFSANYMHIVVDSLATRLSVTGFDVTGDAALTKELNRWMRLMRLNSIQNGVHTGCIRDGDSYGFVEWDDVKKRPVFIPHLAYDGRDGVHAYYDSDRIEPRIFTKRWTIEVGGGVLPIGARRLNLYFEDRVERYWSNASGGTYGWLPFSGEGLPTVSPYETGFPLVHFTNRARGFRYGLSELEPGIPMQDALNKAVIDLLASADASGFRIMVGIGFDPEGITVAPGAWIAVPDLTPAEASATAIPGEPLRPHIEAIDSLVQRVAQTTDTPLSYFQQTGQMASEGTHRQHETRMIAKARSLSVEVGEQWEEVMRGCIRLSNAYGGTSWDEEAEITTIWADFDIRDREEKMLARAQAVKALVEAGADLETAAIEAGFSADVARKMSEMGFVDLERKTRMETDMAVEVAEAEAEVFASSANNETQNGSEPSE